MFLMVPDPEEVRQMQDSRAAHATSHYLEMYSNIEALSSDQLDMVIELLARTLQDEHFGHHMVGVLYGVKRYMHGICGCSPDAPDHKVVDHSDPEFLFQFDKNPEPSEEPSVVFSDQTEPDSVEEASDPKVLIIDHRGNEIRISVIEALKKYNLEWYDEPVAPGLRLHPNETRRRLRCKGCALDYQSIADRALKQPGIEGCEGCQQVNKWGGGKQPWDQ